MAKTALVEGLGLIPTSHVRQLTTACSSSPERSNTSSLYGHSQAHNYTITTIARKKQNIFKRFVWLRTAIRESISNRCSCCLSHLSGKKRPRAHNHGRFSGKLQPTASTSLDFCWVVVNAHVGAPLIMWACSPNWAAPVISARCSERPIWWCFLVYLLFLSVSCYLLALYVINSLI